MGNRLSVYNEVLALPELFSLDNASGAFGEQRNDGSKPIGSDLDNRLGYHARFKWEHDEIFNIQLSRVDNRGDRKLYRGQYAWDTTFNSIGFQSKINFLQVCYYYSVLLPFCQARFKLDVGISILNKKGSRFC